MRKISTFTGMILLQAAMILFPAFIMAGTVQLGTGNPGVSVKESTLLKLELTCSVPSFSFADISTSAGQFSMLTVDGFGRRNIEGEPALPVYRKLIEVPVNATFAVRILNQHFREIDLPEAGINLAVFPAQPPLSKGDDPSMVPFVYNRKAYDAGGWIADELATVTYVGTMRALTLARVDISPVQYNPVEKKLRIYDQLEIEIVFENGNIPATLELKKSKASPYYNSMSGMVLNYQSGNMPDQLITTAPVTYVIVSDPMFQTTLQPFITWKKKKGFKVIEGYTNNPSVGTTTASIKAYLQGLYNTPPAGYNAPSFVLFVGDVAQIPAWAGGAGSHYTDLRYCEYTGDNLPEVYYGRFSATSVAQLQPQIDKTLEYEQYLMPDPSFLNEAVMVAGADGSHQTWSNGQINYGTTNYFNAAHGITSHTYLQPEPGGGNYATNIHNNVSNGVGFSNYTAHCSESGWADPSFLISDIPALNNAHKYSLMVGNCCLSCKFDVTSFAEEMLRAANKGTVGYIGGSNNTYWDEDYWWGCGFKTVVLNPPYDANHIGAYDGTFHDHGEPLADWFVTQGQMVTCGDYAVEESNSSMKQYYWEIYHLMGDPSLMIYYSVPSAITANYMSPLMIGMSSLAVTTEPYAYIALSLNGTLLDAKCADAAGAATLNFTALASPGYADIVITKQNKQPYISTIQIIPAEGPYVVCTGNAVSDPAPGGNGNGQMDFGETNSLNVSLKNVGVEVASNVVATLSSPGSFVTITDNAETYGNIDPSQTVTVNDAFVLTVANNIPDQQVVPFVLQASNGTSNWSTNFSITANAPLLQAGAMTVQDNCPTCNNNGILDPGETASLLIVTTNGGHAGISNVNGTLAIVGGTSPYLVINNSTFAIGTLASGGSASAAFSVTADISTPLGTPVNLTFTASGGTADQYSVTSAKQVVIGLIPEYPMSNTTVTACTGNFYDSGGSSGSYTNNESLTETFYPGTPGLMVRMTFTAFSTESGYDYLYIYDGTSTSATLLGTYNGSTGPGTVTATNAAGALTFKFTSDGSVTYAGWAATISCYNPATPPVANFSATPLNAQTNQTVTFTDLSTGGPTSWAWSFTPNTVSYVDGTSATSQNPHVQFTALGQYTVTLTATNAYGSDGETKTNYISVTNCTIVSYPWTEGFENGGTIPGCWTQEQVNSSGLNWVFITGNGTGYPLTAHGGTYDACLKDATSADNKTRLITPTLDLSQLPGPQVTFWHTQAYWSPDQDILTVYYRTSPTAAWTQLATYTNSITTWTMETLTLPSASDTYQINFEGNAKYGRGVCIDDVTVSSSCATINQVGVSIAASANPVDEGTEVTFTATPGHGGTTPAYQWKVNGSNAGTNSGTYTYIPVQGDAVTCMLTSNESCVTGNPATSNAVTMTVNSVPVNLEVTNVTVTNSQCFDATGTVTVAGNGTTFEVDYGGIARIYAGERIVYNPGTLVNNGGYMLGTIVPGGPYCPQDTKQPGAIAGSGNPSQNAFFRIYPNPTTGTFTLALDDQTMPGKTEVVIYDMQGATIGASEAFDATKHEFSLSGQPAGLYLVRVHSGQQTGSARIIKIY